MRQLSPASNLLLACLTAIALVASVEFPWYAPPLVHTDPNLGGVERVAAQVAYVFRDVGSPTSGAEALGSLKGLVLGLAAAVVALSAGIAVPPLRAALRDVLRGVALAAPAVVAFAIVVRPGEPAGALHWGALATLAIAGVLASAAWHGSTIRVKRPAPGAWARAR